MILRETGLRMEAYSRNYFCFQVIKWYCNPSPVNGRIFEIDLVQHLSNLCPAMHTWNICVFSNSISWFVLASYRRMIIALWDIPYLRQGRSYHQMAAVEVTSHPHIISPLSFMRILMWYRFYGRVYVDVVFTYYNDISVTLLISFGFEVFMIA